jgi:hypothetical protein
MSTGQIVAMFLGAILGVFVSQAITSWWFGRQAEREKALETLASSPDSENVEEEAKEPPVVGAFYRMDHDGPYLHYAEVTELFERRGFAMVRYHVWRDDDLPPRKDAFRMSSMLEVGRFHSVYTTRVTPKGTPYVETLGVHVEEE